MSDILSWYQVTEKKLCILIDYAVSCKLFYIWLLSCWDKFLLYLFLRVFSWIDVKCFLSSLEMIMQFYFVKVEYHMIWFAYVESSFHCKEESHSVRVYNPLKVLWIRVLFLNVHFNSTLESPYKLHLCIHLFIIYHHSTQDDSKMTHSKEFIEIPKRYFKSVSFIKWFSFI